LITEGDGAPRISGAGNADLRGFAGAIDRHTPAPFAGRADPIGRGCALIVRMFADELDKLFVAPMNARTATRGRAAPSDFCIVRLMNGSRPTVVSLGARGDLEEGSGGGASCKVREFALLSDGREVTLLDDRGWTTSAQLGEISLTHAVRNVYTVVLPDDAEETGEEHEWQRFERHLREAGVAVTPDELRALPYRVILSLRLAPGAARR
jgi:hypothetical protein